MIIGLTGQMASGKSTIAAALKRIGYEYVTLSSIIREECQKQKLPEERENMMNVGQKLREKYGAGVLAARALKKIKKSNTDKWVVDGIRNPAEVEELRKNPDFILIANTAPEELIINRIFSRKRADDTLDKWEIRRKLRREMGEGEAADGQQVGKCIEMADYTFKNIMPLEKVEEEFMKMYNRILRN